MKKLALIPARAGSKRLPNKNIVNLNGKPLISYTIDVVLRSLCFDDVVVSTDDSKVKSICNEYSDLCVEERPPELATDIATVAQVLRQLITENSNYKDKYEIYGIFLPTSPFRKVVDIRNGMELLTKRVDSVISVSEYNAPPQYAMRIKTGGRLQAVNEFSFITGKTRKQQQEILYHQVGLLYIGWVSSFLKYCSFFLGTVAPYIIPNIQAIDIDNSFDLFVARSVMTNLKG